MRNSPLSTLPCTVFLEGIIPFLSTKEAVRFDSAITDKSYREDLSKQITTYVNNVMGEMYSIVFKELEWLTKRKAIITSIRFRGNIFFDEQSLKLAELLSISNDTVTELSLDIDNAKDLIPCLPSLPNLERFTLYADWIPPSLRLFWPQHNNLKHITLCGRKYRGSDVLIILAKNCTLLESFVLINIDYAIDCDIDALATYCPLLERVYLLAIYDILPKNALNNNTLVKLVTNCVRLKELSLSGFEHITDETVAAFTRYTPYILHLSLSGCKKLTNTSLSYIIEHCHQLQSIDLTKCPLVTKSGYLQLKLIPTLTSITMFDQSRTEYIINPQVDEALYDALIERAILMYNPSMYYDDDDIYIDEWYDDDDGEGQNSDPYEYDDFDDCVGEDDCGYDDDYYCEEDEY